MGQPSLGNDFLGLDTHFIGCGNTAAGFAGIHELAAVTAELVARGHSDETFLKVIGGNSLRVFDTSWGG